MKVMRTLFIILLALIYVGQWLMIAHQSIELDSRRIPDERLIELLEQSHLNERRLASVAAQNEALTSKTQAVLDRLVPAPPFTVCHEPDQALVLYEAEPVKAPVKKGRRK
jgi:hypothetical protein